MCLWVMGKTETLSCPEAQVKGGHSLAEVGDRRKQRWFLGCIWGSPSWLCPTHWGMERTLGPRETTSATHRQPRRGLARLPQGRSTSPGRNGHWVRAPRPQAGPSCLGVGSGLGGKGRIKKDGKRPKSWKKRKVGEGKRGRDGGWQHEAHQAPGVPCCGNFPTGCQPLISARLGQCRCHLRGKQVPNPE